MPSRRARFSRRTPDAGRRRRDDQRHALDHVRTTFNVILAPFVPVPADQIDRRHVDRDPAASMDARTGQASRQLQRI
jgi:Asp-tRNA(Asn)/Glu-tRNA(Gln) amidotransferase A subunit family amidase